MRKCPRRTASLLAGACTTAVALIASDLRAGVRIDMIAVPGPGYLMLDSGKSVLPVYPSATIKLGVYATISGTNSAQQIGDWDGDEDAPDTRNDDPIYAVVGSFTSLGPLLGDMNNTAGPLNYDSRHDPFLGGGSQNGTASDFDSDGDLDIGATGTDVTNMWVAAGPSGRRVYPTRFDGTANGWSMDNASGGGAPFDGLDPEAQVLSAQSGILRVGTVNFTVTAGSGTASINFIIRPVPGSAASIIWWEDGATMTAKNPATGSFVLGAPVVVGIPEPAAAGLAGLVGLGLLARRPARPRNVFSSAR